jgi:hypothetical protein
MGDGGRGEDGGEWTSEREDGGRGGRGVWKVY